MSIKINEIRVKNSQNLVKIPNVGSFKFIEHTKENPVTCWDCDFKNMGICAVVPCSMSFRSDYKDGVFQSLNK